MRLTGQRIGAFLRKPDPTILAILLYGPDQGLVRERADRVVATVAGDNTDPFRTAELTAEQLRDDPVRLADEAAALPFSRGRRTVRVREGRDSMVEAVRNLFEVCSGGGLVVVEAAELGPRSPLRQLFEAAPHAAALPCYPDEGDGLRQLIQQDLASHGLTVTPEATDVLATLLGADRALTRSELQKLALYKGQSGQVEVEDVVAVIGGAGAVSLDAIAYAACTGDFATLDRTLAAAAAEGTPAIPVLRAVARHLHRLLQANAAVANGSTAKQATDGLKPWVIFRLQAQFRRQMTLWRPDRLAEAFLLLTETELQCKQTGAPQDLLCHHAMFHLAKLARSA